MSTVNYRVQYLQRKLKKRPLSIDEKKMLGKQIADHYHHQDKIKIPIQRVVSNEPEGRFVVLSYPSQYTPQMDEIITSFLSSIPDIKKRKRIAAIKAFSAKPSIKISGHSSGQSL